MESQITANKNNPRIISFLNHHFWIVPTLISVAIFFITTHHGIGLSPDSIAYLGVAENIKNGSGITVPYGLPPNQPLTQFPPLLPILLALISEIGISIATSAKILNFVLLIIFIGLSYLIIWKINAKPSFFRSAIFLFISVFISTISIFNMLWSEPLMIVLGMGGLLVFNDSQSKNNLFVAFLAGFIFALAITSRYAGITFLFSALFFVLINKLISWKRKLLHWFFLLTPTLTILPVWLLRDIGNGVSSTGRSINFHPLTISHVHQLLNTIASWFQLQGSTATIIKLTVSLLLIGFFVVIGWVLIFSKRVNEQNIAKILIVFGYIYMLFVTFSIIFLDANIPLDTRILSPLLVILLLLIAYIPKLNIPLSIRIKNLSKIFVVIIPIFTIFVFLNNFPLLKQAYQNGIGFNSLAWKNFESLKYVNKLDGNYQLISNAPEPVYFYTNHEVYSLPKKFLSMQQEENLNYQSELQELISNELIEETYFVFFHDIKGGSESDISVLQTEFQFELENGFKEATIYKYIPGNN